VRNDSGCPKKKATGPLGRDHARVVVGMDALRFSAAPEAPTSAPLLVARGQRSAARRGSHRARSIRVARTDFSGTIWLAKQEGF